MHLAFEDSREWTPFSLIPPLVLSVARACQFRGTGRPWPSFEPKVGTSPSLSSLPGWLQVILILLHFYPRAPYTPCTLNIFTFRGIEVNFSSQSYRLCQEWALFRGGKPKVFWNSSTPGPSRWPGRWETLHKHWSWTYGMGCPWLYQVGNLFHDALETSRVDSRLEGDRSKSIQPLKGHNAV